MADLEGFDELMKALDETALNLTSKKKLIVKSLNKAGDIVLEEQRNRAPDDPDTPGSRVRDNLGKTVMDQTAIGAEGRVGSKKWGHVARFGEYGTIHQRGRPFMGPAFDATEEQAMGTIAQVLGDGIEESYTRG